jgi:hypothetical protein
MSRFLVMICYALIVLYAFHRAWDYFDHKLENKYLVALNTIGVITGLQFLLILLCWVVSH